MSKQKTVSVAALVVAALAALGLLALSAHRVGWIAPLPRRPKALARRAAEGARTGLQRQ
jgi:hypothetical protein